jgi:nitrite reductase (NADH) small subunit
MSAAAVTLPPATSALPTAPPATGEPPQTAALTWVEVCRVDDITPDTGVAALVRGVQVAIVRVGAGQGGDAQIFAVGNYDPFSRAFVIARGIVGDRSGVPKIASPIFKQNFDLRTGQCLDDASVRLPAYPVRVRDGRIAIGIAQG